MNQFPINKFSHKFTSQIRPIKIYLPNNKAENDGSDANFIGRKLLMDKLYNWIQDKNARGSFLVAGFRGMGKTSMVNRVLDRLKRDIKDWRELCGYVSLLALLCSICCWLIKEQNSDSVPQWLLLVLSALSVIFAIITLWRSSYIWSIITYPNWWKFSRRQVKKMVVGDDVDITKASYRNITIKVNLGHEVLKERDVLSMVASTVREKYKRYFRSVQAHFVFYYLAFAVVGACACGLTIYLHSLSEPEFVNNLVSYGDYISLPKDNDTLTINVVDDNWFAREFYNICQAAYQFVVDDRVVPTIILFALLSLLVWLVLRWLLTILPFTSVPFRALKKLNVLTERIIASTDEESGSSSSFEKSGISISLFGGRKKKSYPKADIREIEQNLSSIINMLNVKHHPFRANFIVVFDEMDKIDPELSVKAADTDMPEFTDSVAGFPDGLDSRDRRQNVLRLLANMKLFLSTADAKFIFISGRELYDAYLADLSDRDYSISSIFSGVINVDSFLSPEDDQTDVKSMAEWYIAKQLLPKEYLEKVELSNARDNETLKQERPSLRWYYQYLYDSIGKNDANVEEKRRDVIYTVMFLHAYAAYLTHISNGSPKKMFLYFTKYIRKAKDVDMMNDWKDVCEVGVRYSDEQNVLWFDPPQQKTVNFVHYLIDSFMHTITNDYSKYGDRFLVSLTFIIDHLYKHHSRAFSWRNLEQIPDLFKTNRAPELRDSLASIMEYLMQLDIVKIPIGLNEFKFKKSISEEISLLSRISDEASALFNFTLDESSSVIQHNTRILQYYMDLAKSDPNAAEKYYTVLARIHANLGDLHFWDEDYYKASLEYRNAIQLLRRRDAEEYNSFLSIVRCSLKLGLTYESRKLYLNAYQHYCKLVDTLIKHRWIDEESLGLKIVDQRIQDWRGKRRILVNNEACWNYKDNSPRDRFEQQFDHQLCGSERQHNHRYSVNVDGMISSLARDLTPEKSQIIGQLTLFEEVRYLYQVILAKLSIVEKMEMSGITQTNIEVAEGEFNILHKSVNVKEKFVIAADFFRKLAEILYYKNSLTLSSQNQNSIYSSLYYADVDLLANLDDFCLTNGDDAIQTKYELKNFFYGLDDVYKTVFYTTSVEDIFRIIRDKCNKEVVKSFCDKNIEIYQDNEDVNYNIGGVEGCSKHRNVMRQKELRTPCLACKYYNRSIRILLENLYGEKVYREEFDSKYKVSKAVSILHHTFKRELIYASSTHLDMFAKSVEGFGNIQLSCASKENDKYILSFEVVDFLSRVCYADDAESEKIIGGFNPRKLTKLDKCLLYYFDAYRIYLMVDHYDSAVSCINKIITVLSYYAKIIRFYAEDYDEETSIVKMIIGEDTDGLDDSLVGKLYRLVVRYTVFKYDLSSHAELRDLRWIYSRESYGDIDLMSLSLYPDIRCSFLRIMQIVADGIRYVDRINDAGYSERYCKHIASTYGLIAPARRFETTSYDDVIGLYTKACYNEHIMNCLFDGSVMTSEMVRDENNHRFKHYGAFYVTFYEKLSEFLGKRENDYITTHLFRIDNTIKDRLDIIEYLITDSLTCLSNIARLITQHNNLSSYSKSFGGIVHNYMWEWSHKYELLMLLYRYQEIDVYGRQDEVTALLNSVRNRIIDSDCAKRFDSAINKCRDLMGTIDSIEIKPEEFGENLHSYGRRSDILYARLRRDIDDVSIGTIFSNYSAESAINYYKMAFEENTEGDAYKEMIASMHFLDDDFNNDTSQFNLACERLLMNFEIVQTQKARLEYRYKKSRIYRLSSWLKSEDNFYSQVFADKNQFERSRYINSEY